MAAGLYLIRCRITKSVYVGHSANIAQRLRQHRNRLNNATHTNPHLKAAWRKYGANAFRFRVLTLMESAELRCAEEIRLIAKWRSKGRTVYNVGNGGEHQQHTENSRRKIGDSHRGKSKPTHVIEVTRQRFLGKQLSDEHRKAISDALKEHFVIHKRPMRTQEHRKNLSQALKGRKPRIWTDEQRANQSKRCKGKPLSPEHCQKLSQARARALARGQRSRLKLVTFDGKTLSINDWAALTGIERRTLGYRLGRGGWDIAKALTTPVRSR